MFNPYAFLLEVLSMFHFLFDIICGIVLVVLAAPMVIVLLLFLTIDTLCAILYRHVKYYKIKYERRNR